MWNVKVVDQPHVSSGIYFLVLLWGYDANVANMLANEVISLLRNFNLMENGVKECAGVKL